MIMKYVNVIQAMVGAVLALASPRLHAAELKLASVFSDHMVLQRGQEVPVWGWADASATVTVEFAGQTRQTTADATGKWQVKLPPVQASREPRELTVASVADARVSIRDVLVGDVWLCSGQSNMDMSMAPFLPWHRGVLDHEREIAAAEHPTLRLFHVLPIPSHHPVRDVHGEWLACSPATVADFSGVAYYFGRMMLRESGVPQGLVLSALGGTAIECWQKYPPFQAARAAGDRHFSLQGTDTFRSKFIETYLLTAGDVQTFKGPQGTGTFDLSLNPEGAQFYHRSVCPLRYPVPCATLPSG